MSPTFIGAGPVANRVAAGSALDLTLSVRLNEPPNAEYLALFTEATINISNVWTVGIWAKPTLQNDFGSYELFGIGGFSSDVSRIRLLRLDNADPAQFLAIAYNDSGIIFKLYRYDGTVVDAAWHHYAATWDGTNLRVYIDGSEISPTILSVDNAGTQNDSARSVTIGQGGNAGGFPWFGKVGHTVVWSTDLGTTALTEVASQKFNFDPTVNSGGYSQAANAVHWWPVGARGSFPAAWADEIGGLNLPDGNVADANIVTDAP